jgi:hypothetical protein
MASIKRDPETIIDERVPFSTYQYVDVTFPSSANTDLVITHTLSVTDPESVRYIPVDLSSAGVVYRDKSATRRAWGNGYIILRASSSSLQARLLLCVER